MKKMHFLRKKLSEQITGILVAFHSWPKSEILRWKSARNEFVKRMKEITIKRKMNVINYLITPHSAYLLLRPEDWEQLTGFVNHLRSSASIACKHRKPKSELPCWKGRVNYTLILGRKSLKNC